MAANAIAVGAARRSRSRLLSAIVRIVQRPLSFVGLVFVVILVITAALGPLLAPYDPLRPDTFHPLAAPEGAHLLGTDFLGRDVLSRLLYGAAISLQVGVISVVLASVPGTVIGIVAAYRGGWADDIINRLLDTLMAFPSLVLALTIVAVLGSSLVNLEIAIAVTSLPYYARLARGQVLAVREFDYITAIRSVGARDVRIMFRHVLPNVTSPALVQASLGVGFAITAEASLSFLGLGVQPPTPTWGTMIQTGFQYLEVAPWLVIAPATMIFMAVLGFNLLGESIREALDPMAAQADGDS